MASRSTRNEEERLQALYRYGLLDTPPEPDYDELAELAAEACGVPIALISLVDRNRQWFKARVGLPEVRETERSVSICSHAIEQPGLFIVEDAQADERFRDNPLVRGEPYIRFYAGAPLRTEEGLTLGALCIIDRAPRSLSGFQRRTLERLRRQIERRLHLHHQLREAQSRNVELEQTRARLHVLNESLQAEMRERQRAEQELRSQQELLSSVLSHIPHSVFWKDRSGVFLGCNEKLARDLGRGSPAEIVGLTDHDLGFPQEQVEAYRRDDLEVMETGQPKLGIEEPVRGEEDLWVLTSKVPLRHPDGTVRGVLGIFADITERRRQESALQEAKRRLEQQIIQSDRLSALGVLAASIAHEINNPAGYLLANLDYLQQWRDKLEQQLSALPHLPAGVAATLDEARQVIADCAYGSTTISDIVHDMRYLSHTGPDEHVLAVDVHSSLEAVLRIAHGELKHTARLEKDFTQSLPAVLGSQGRLSQVFLNLIINATHAMRPGSPEQHMLHVRTRQEGRQVRIDISDTGHGISPEVLPRIFDPFFTTKPASIGTGLGLSISHSIVQRMGGELRVESRVGQGSTFSVLLPACEEAHAA